MSGLDADSFSVREFARTAQGSHRGELDLDRYSDEPLAPGIVEVVDLLARLERGAMAYLRSVLITPTHNDARVTGFLVTWAYEKYWVADALELVVAANRNHRGEHAAGVPVLRRVRRVRHALGERLEPIIQSVVTNVIGDDVVAVHTAAGAIDEWITQAAYERLAATSRNAEFTRTLTRLMDVKRRHGDFFAVEARDRLAASAGARRLARRRLGRTAWPLGADTEPPSLVSRLLGDVVPASALAAIDARVATLPGLADLNPAARSAARTRKAVTR